MFNGGPTTAGLLRFGGLAAMLSGVGFALFMVLHPNHEPANYERPIWIIAHMMPHLAAIFGTLGLTALYARQVERAGWLGFAGYLLACIGNGLILMMGWVEIFILPFLELRFPRLTEEAPPPGMEIAGPLTMAVFAAGYVLFGLATARAGVWPRPAGVLLAVGASLFAFGEAFLAWVPGLNPELPMLVGGIVLGAGLVWLGLARWLYRGDVRPAQPVREAAAPAVSRAA